MEIKDTIKNYCVNCDKVTQWNFDRMMGYGCNAARNIPAYKCNECGTKEILENLKNYHKSHLEEKLKGGNLNE